MSRAKIYSVLSNGVHIPAQLCQLTFESFNKIFESLLADGKTQKEAYEIMETAHKKLFQDTRYSSYDSFRKVRERHINDK